VKKKRSDTQDISSGAPTQTQTQIFLVVEVVDNEEGNTIVAEGVQSDEETDRLFSENEIDVISNKNPSANFAKKT
jgi:hypothetical protein